MVQVKRTYPQPDSPQPNIGPRERAMAVYKYLLDMEPDTAVRHPRFDLVRHAFEQAGRAAVREFQFNLDEEDMPVLDDSYCEPLTSSQDVGPVEVQPYTKLPKTL